MENNYFTGFRDLWLPFRSKVMTPEVFMKVMLENGYQPSKITWFNRQCWTIDEAVLIYHNWDPSKFKNVQWETLKDFIEFIDQDDDIYGLLDSYIPSKWFTNESYLRVEKIIKLFIQKDIKIPSHYPAFLTHTDADMSCTTNTDLSNETLTTKQIKNMRRDTIRKNMFKLAAEAWWKKEKSEGLPFTPPFQLARKNEFKQLAKRINAISGLRPLSNDEEKVDPEYFSYLYPGDSKPGPKSK